MCSSFGCCDGSVYLCAGAFARVHMGEHMPMIKAPPLVPSNVDDLPEHPLPLALTITEAVKVTGVGRSTIYAELAAGRLKARKLGTRTLITSADLREWLAALPDFAPARPGAPD